MIEFRFCVGDLPSEEEMHEALMEALDESLMESIKSEEALKLQVAALRRVVEKAVSLAEQGLALDGDGVVEAKAALQASIPKEGMT